MTDLRNTPCDCPVVELRQYTLHPGQREPLIELFDREFIESQEALGIAVIGQFRDLDRPDRFVWLRGFPNMPARARALAAFYGGPVWQAHRDAANSTMLDSDNVLLLRPTSDASGFAIDRSPRRTRGDAGAAGIVVATIYCFDAQVDARFSGFFDEAMAPRIEAAGGELLARLVSETAENNFPRLPVRAGEQVFVWFARFDDVAAHARFRASLASAHEVQAALDEQIAHEDILRLAPTSRSRLPVTMAVA